MTTNTNNANATRRNASHANCEHTFDKTIDQKRARAKCRREMRALNTSYDALRNDHTRVDVIDAHALKINAIANVDVDQMTFDDVAIA